MDLRFTNTKVAEEENKLTFGDKKGILNIQMDETGATTKFDSISGSLSGGLERYSDAAEKHAAQYYESVRKMKNDVDAIAKNTNFNIDDVQNIKEYLFIAKHDLGDGELSHFHPDYEIAQSWQRLIDGRNIESRDIVLLKHELLEREYTLQGLDQNTAHIKAEEKFNYAKLLKGR